MSREDVVRDARFQRFAAGEGPSSDAVEAVLDAAVNTARNVADALLRQATALLLLASMLVGEVVALIPLLTDDPDGLLDLLRRKTPFGRELVGQTHGLRVEHVQIEVDVDPSHASAQRV